VVASTLPAAGSTINLTNGGGVYSFYLTGGEAGTVPPNFYALTGSVLLDASGDIISGEQDYNDGIGLQSPEPLPDTIAPLTAGLSLVNGQGTLTLVTSNPALGVAGTETLGVQFVNNNHALIIEFDGFATSSGSLDLQQQPSGPSGNFAFELSGINSADQTSVIGGVFSATPVAGPPPTSALTGVFDYNIAGTALSGTVFTTGVASAPDFYGRGTITGTGIATTFVYYVIGPEAIRMIDVDLTDSVGGSAFGQGSATFTDASLGSSVFGIESNSEGTVYAAAGQIIAPAAGALSASVGDDDEEGAVVSGAVIDGTYSISNTVLGTVYNGYSNLTITAGELGDVSLLGVYFTDPALNISDPNNPAGGGGALVVDLDTALVGTGVLIPQTDNTIADFTGNYAFGGQDFWGCAGVCEFDFVGQGTVTAGAFSGTGLVSDPADFFGGTATDTAVTFSSTPLPDPLNLGRYTMFTTNTTPNPLAVTVPTTPEEDFDVVIYQASGTQLFWLDEDTFSLWLGPMEQQGTLSGLAAVKRAPAKTKTKKK
jgi:hypothetical protein